jgi:hypothetical protein
MAKTPQRSHHAHPQPARRPDRDYEPPQAQAPAEDAPPTQAELDRDREPLSPDEAEQLLRAGTRLRIKGEDPANWIAMSRHSGDLAVAYAATPEAIEVALNHELLVADA